MKIKNILIPAALILALTTYACGALKVPVVTVTVLPPTATQPLATPTEVPTSIPSTPTITPTAVAPTSPQPTPPPLPTKTQLAASAHYRVGDAVQLDEIHMSSPTEGWGISGAYVLVTADGGQTWREVTPPESLPAGTQDKAYGVFLDTQTAWIVFSVDDHVAPDASVWHTQDGGRSWTPSAPLLHQVYGDSVWAEFAALDAKNVWLLMRGVYVGAGTHYDAQLLHTTDGGLTWTSLDGDVGVDYTGMVFADASNGWLTWQTTGAYAPAPPAYAVTVDGGANWQSRELPPPSGTTGLFDRYDYCEPFQPHLLSSRSVRLLMGCFDDYLPPKEFTSYLYTSEDGGTTWETYQMPVKVLASQDTLVYFDAHAVWLLGRDIYSSADGGRTWSYVKTVNWDGQFSVVDPQHVWAVARANKQVALVTTANGGLTWAEIKPTIAK